MKLGYLAPECRESGEIRVGQARRVRGAKHEGLERHVDGLAGHGPSRKLSACTERSASPARRAEIEGMKPMGVQPTQQENERE